MAYDANSKISPDTRRSHKDMFTHDPKNPEMGLALGRAFRNLDAAVLAGAAEFSNLWTVYEKESQADNIDRDKYLAEEFKAMAEKLAKELNQEGKYALTQGERMELLLYIADLYDKSYEYEERVKKAIRVEIESMKMTPTEVNNLLIEASNIKMAHNLRNSIKPYNSRQKFSLATFEKTYVQGKVDRDLSSANPKKYMNGKTTTDYMVTPWKNSLYESRVD